MRMASVPRPMPVTLHQRPGDLRRQPPPAWRSPSSEARIVSRRAIGHHADVQAGQRPGHHRRIAHVLDGVAVALLGVGVVVGVDVVLDADRGHLLHSGAELLHVAGDHHGVVAGIEAAHRVVERYVGGQGDELVALPGLHVAHGLEAVGHAHVHVAAGDGLPGFLEAEPAGGAAAFHPVPGLGAQAQVVLGHDAGHQLAGEVIGEIGGHRAIHQAGEGRKVEADIVDGVVVGFFDDRLEGLVGPCFGKLGNTPADSIDWTHN